VTSLSNGSSTTRDLLRDRQEDDVVSEETKTMVAKEKYITKLEAMVKELEALFDLLVVNHSPAHPLALSCAKRC